MNGSADIADLKAISKELGAHYCVVESEGGVQEVESRTHKGPFVFKIQDDDFDFCCSFVTKESEIVGAISLRLPDPQPGFDQILKLGVNPVSENCPDMIVDVHVRIFDDDNMTSREKGVVFDSNKQGPSGNSDITFLTNVAKEAYRFFRARPPTRGDNRYYVRQYYRPYGAPQEQRYKMDGYPGRRVVQQSPIAPTRPHCRPAPQQYPPLRQNEQYIPNRYAQHVPPPYAPLDERYHYKPPRRVKPADSPRKQHHQVQEFFSESSEGGYSYSDEEKEFDRRLNRRCRKNQAEGATIGHIFPDVDRVDQTFSPNVEAGKNMFDTMAMGAIQASLIDIKHLDTVMMTRVHPERRRASSSQTKTIQPSGRRRALLMGLNYRGTSNELSGAESDVKRMYTLIQGIYRFPSDEILVLTDTSRLRPNKEGILKAISWLVKDVQPGDVLMLTFSGHGLQVRDSDMEETDGYDEALLPLDAQSASEVITDDELYAGLVQPLMEGVKLTCIFDCCHSGGGLDLGYEYEFSSCRFRRNRVALHSPADVTLISGCSNIEKSQDVQMRRGAKNLSGGALTLSLVSEIARNPDIHTYVSIVQQLTKAIHSKGFVNQTPQLSASQCFSPNRKFNPITDILPNSNEYVGPTDRYKETHKKRHKRHYKSVVGVRFR